MSESPFEELEAREQAERADEARKDAFNSRVTLTIAVMAVLAAVGASLETTEGDKTIVAKNDAVLQQNQASDQWAEYEAKSLKKNLYGIAAAEGGPKAADYARTAARNGADQEAVARQAKAFEARRDAFTEQAERHERRHDRLTLASTLLHTAIAIATLAILLRRPWPWYTAIALTLGGVALTGWAYWG
ncbi:MAG: DUF4337 domain-containing protein [Alphaproteobacteria bacterium]|nr:DUF4337 domain-containing protein [Alphaproteobacteria bacterium]